MVNFCEFDKYAAKSYCAIHSTDETLNLGDITKVDETAIPSFNMICGGSQMLEIEKALFGPAENAGTNTIRCKCITVSGISVKNAVRPILIRHVPPFW